MRYADPKLIDRLASSYALGTLAGGARRRFERLRRDRADVALVTSEWESRLARLAQTVPPRQPSPQLWAAIAARTRPVAAPAPLSRPGWLQPAWWGLGGLAAGITAAAALFLTAPALILTADQVAMRTGERLPQSYVGLLTDAQGNGKLLVSSLCHGRTMTVKVIGPIEPPAPGTRLVLWAVPANAPAFMLGPVPASGSATSQLPATSEQLLAKVGKLVVTQETQERPAAPGAPLYSGNCAKLW
jgi:anti-sigma-K factor RskA